MIDLIEVGVGILSVLGAVTGWYISKDLNNYSDLRKVSKHDFDN